MAERAGRRLRNEELLVAGLGATILRKHLDEVPLWRGGDHVAVRQLVEDFGRYLYLPRLRGPEVLTRAVQDGVALLTWESDSFALAESHDEAVERYRGLQAGQSVGVSPRKSGPAGQTGRCPPTARRGGASHAGAGSRGSGGAATWSGRD